MAKVKKTHKDVEYAVPSAGIGRDGNFKTFDEAAAHAVIIALTRGKADIDVLIWSKAGANFYGGDEAVEQYNEDPEASVFERFEVRVNAVGRVP